MSGNTCPGCTRSSGRVRGSMATRMVCARSAADMPVVTPSRASMDTVKAVPKREVLLRTIGSRCSSSALLGGDGQADESPAVGCHEVDGLRRDELGRHGQVALVLPVLIVHHDDHPAALDLLESLLDGRESFLHTHVLRSSNQANPCSRRNCSVRPPSQQSRSGSRRARSATVPLPRLHSTPAATAARSGRAHRPPDSPACRP